MNEEIILAKIKGTNYAPKKAKYLLKIASSIKINGIGSRKD